MVVKGSLRLAFRCENFAEEVLGIVFGEVGLEQPLGDAGENLRGHGFAEFDGALVGEKLQGVEKRDGCVGAGDGGGVTNEGGDRRRRAQESVRACGA